MKKDQNIQKTLHCFSALLFLFWIGPAFFLAHCDRSGQVLATYTKDNTVHTVKRQELRWLIKMQTKGASAVKPSSDLQQKVLKSYLLDQIVAHELDPEAVKQSEAYRQRALFIEEKIKLSTYELYLREKDEKLSYDFIETQLILLNKETQDEEPGKADPKSRQKEADELLAQLNSPKMIKKDEEIEEKVYQVSEHPRYRLQGGYLDPICISCSVNPLSDFMEEIEKAKPGKFIKITRPNAVWILRVVKQYTVDADELRSKLEAFYRKSTRVARKYVAKLPANDSRKANLNQILLSQEKIESLAKSGSERLIQQERQSLILAKVNKLKKQKNYVLHEAAKRKANPKKEAQAYKDDTLLYSIGGKDHTYGDLKKKLAAAKEIKDIPRQLSFLQSVLIPMHLLEGEEDFQKSFKSKVYPFVRAFIRRKLLTLAYYEQERERVAVKPAEVLKHYQEAKASRYRSMPKRKALELSRKQLKQNAFVEWLQTRQKELAEKYKLVIKNELLEADNV